MDRYVNIISSIPTAAAFALVSSLVPVQTDMPVSHIQSLIQNNGYNLIEGFGDSITKYHVAANDSGSMKNIETIHEFATNLLDNIEDLDPEFSKVIDENFWDLV